MSTPGTALPQDLRRPVLRTYRSLRLATVVLTLLLAAAVVLEAGASGWCWQTSVSAYWWTSARGVVVAALCALGACLVVYHGSSDTEDALLDAAGFLAFVVAVVPTAPEPLCGGLGIPAGAGVEAGVRNNLAAVLVAGVAAQGVAAVLAARDRGRPPWTATAWAARVLGWLVVAAVAVAFVVAPDVVLERGHSLAAVGMFAAIIAVVVAEARACGRSVTAARYRRAYLAVAVAMAVTLVAVVVAHLALPRFAHAVLVVEALLVLEFAGFWVVQTVELWGVVARDEGDVVARDEGDAVAATSRS